jgi:hypothetical protein
LASTMNSQSTMSISTSLRGFGGYAPDTLDGHNKNT